MRSAGIIVLFTCCLGSALSQRDARNPRITAITIRQLRDAGESVTLACSVRDAENITLEWVKLPNEEKGQLTTKIISMGDTLLIKEPRIEVRNFPNYRSLQISNLTAKDVGTYQCRLGNNITSKVELLIRSHPVILDISTKNVIVKEGESATLACLASGYPDPKIYWSRREIFTPDESKVTGNIIRISNVTKEDRGRYYCLAVNSLGKTNYSIDVDVVFPPVMLSTASRAVVVPEGGATALACHAEGSPIPKIYWSRNENFIEEQADAQGEILNLTNITKQDKGRYYCLAVNSLGKTNHSIDVNVVYPPVMLSTSSRSVVIAEGETAKLTCHADGSPAPEIYWSRDENFIAEQAEASGEILSLTNITRKDKGAYHCLAVNSLGQSKLTSEVDVVYPPVMLPTSTRTVVVPEGGTAVMKCHADAFPAPEVFWSRTEHFSAEEAVAVGEVVNITNVTPKSRGRYYCLAVNSLGESRHSIDVEIEFQPVFVDKSSDIEFEEGQMAVLNCSSIGYPEPKVYWSLKENFTASEATYQGDILAVKHISRAHRGRYHCLAINDVGEVRKSIDVQVAFAPIFLDKNLEVGYAEGDIGRLNCSVDGYPVPTVYWGRTEDFNASDATYKGGYYDIIRVTKLHRGQYFCLAENNLGQVRKMINVEVKFPPKVYIPNPVTSALAEGEMSLRCDVSGYPAPQITWNKNKTVLENGTHFQISESRVDASITNSTIRIFNIEDNHFGLYTCKASNDLGADSGTVNLLQIEIKGLAVQKSRFTLEPSPSTTFTSSPTTAEPITAVTFESLVEATATTDAPKSEFIKIQVAVEKLPTTAADAVPTVPPTTANTNESENRTLPEDFVSYFSKYKSRFEEMQDSGKEEKLDTKINP